MLVERARTMILGIVLGLLAACGGGGGNGDPGTPTQGGLALTIGGLPSGTAAQVRVTGPAGFSQAVTASQTPPRWRPAITPSPANRSSTGH